MDILKQLKEELGIELWQVEAVVTLIDEGNTIPFIARYRKEKHGALDDEQLRNLNERLTYLRNLEDKKQQVLASIEEQGKLTEQLKAQILEAKTQVVEYSILLKDSAMCFALGTPEIMARTHFVASRTYEHLPLYITAGLIYFAITMAGVTLLRHLERKARIPGYNNAGM